MPVSTKASAAAKLASEAAMTGTAARQPRSSSRSVRDRIAVAVTARRSSIFDAPSSRCVTAPGISTTLLNKRAAKKNAMNQGIASRRHIGRGAEPFGGPIQSDASSTSGASSVTRASLTMVA